MLLKDLSNEKLFKVVSQNETLRRSFDDYVWECELDYITEKLAVMESALSTWEIGLNNPNYIRVKDYGTFIYCARECEKVYGLSDRCEKYLAHCEKLQYTNLFEHHAKQFAEMWFKDEIQDVVKYVEDLSYKVYCGKDAAEAFDYLETWAECVDYIFDEDDETVWTPMKKVS